MKHGRPDPVADAALQPLRFAWDGVQLHAHPTITADEIEGIIARLKRLQEALTSHKHGIIIPLR